MSIRDWIGPCEDKNCFYCKFVWKFFFPFQAAIFLFILVIKLWETVGK